MTGDAALRRSLPAEVRCRHDMVSGTCAICRGLPDVPLLDYWSTSGAAGGGSAVEYGRVRWVESRAAMHCARCNESVKRGGLIAWSSEDAGYVGQCCEDYL